MNTSIEIKYLVDCQEHLTVLAKLWYEELSRHWFADATIEGKLQELITHLNTTTLPLTIVAFLENKPVGIASLRQSDGLDVALTPWLGSLVVDPIFRRQKIGETLVNKINVLAKSLGHRIIHLIALDPNITHWYKRLGWEHVCYDTLQGLPVTIMKKDISNG